MLSSTLRRQLLCDGKRCMPGTPSIPALLPRIPSRYRPQTFKNVQSVRRASTEAVAARKKITLPETINVYRVGTAATMSVGMTRVGTLVIFAVGALGYAPSFFLSSEHSSWWTPVFIIGSAIPMLAVALATGPMVHAIKVRLPSRARRSKEELIHFSKYTAPDTLIEVQFMRWAPWPLTRTHRFDRLRRLVPSFKGGISNLEVVSAEQDTVKSHPRWARLVAVLHGKYYVKRDQKNDRSAVPGVWDNMWRQLPFKGDRGDPELTSSSNVQRALKGGRRASEAVAKSAPK